MRNSFPKSVELQLRRLVIFLLRFIVNRNNQQTGKIDFNSSKILFIRQDRIGDVLVSTPIFQSLKNHYPSAIIDVLLSTNNQFVLENDPLIRKRWIYKKKAAKIISLVKSLRKEKYDFAVDLMDNPSVTSTIFCLLAGARWNVGIAKENHYVYDFTVPMLSRSKTHIIDRIAQLLIPFRIDPASEDLAIRYWTKPQSDEFVDRFLSENQLCNQLLIGINISAGGAARFWGIDQYRRFLILLFEVYPEFHPILLYQPSDREKASAIVNNNSHVLLSPVTNTFDEFAAFIKKLSVLVSPDTSAIHLASAFHIPSVVLYVQSDKSLRIWEPYGTDYEAVITDVDDLSTIPVTAVEEAFRKLIARLPRNQKRIISEPRRKE
ncbi:MAG: glycosyltransferase family 9 protein [Ignavibacteriae bacterium]|nr:MAG: glycosyltransferase family 9 protein [Ignavibacteriota bacterium]